jgi:hypothetical protein
MGQTTASLLSRHKLRDDNLAILRIIKCQKALPTQHERNSKKIPLSPVRLPQRENETRFPDIWTDSSAPSCN